MVITELSVCPLSLLIKGWADNSSVPSSHAEKRLPVINDYISTLLKHGAQNYNHSSHNHYGAHKDVSGLLPVNCGMWQEGKIKVLKVCRVLRYLQKVLWLLFSVQLSCGGCDQTCKKHNKISNYKTLGFILYVNLSFRLSSSVNLDMYTLWLNYYIIFNKLEKHLDSTHRPLLRESERERSNLSSFILCQYVPHCMSLDRGRKSENPREHQENMRIAQRKAPSPRGFKPRPHKVHRHTENFKISEKSRVRSSTVDSWSFLQGNVLWEWVSALQNIHRWNEREAHACTLEVLFYTSVDSTMLQR